MTSGIIITALPFMPLFEQELEGLSDYQNAVGGFIEPITLPDPALTMYINEDGKSTDLVPNLRATALWWVLDPTARRRDIVLGTAVVTAEVGDVRAQSFLAAIQHQRRFRVEVQTRGASESWVPTSASFDNWFAAAVHALVLEQDWEAVEGIRVTPA